MVREQQNLNKTWAQLPPKSLGPEGEIPGAWQEESHNDDDLDAEVLLDSQATYYLGQAPQGESSGHGR